MSRSPPLLVPTSTDIIGASFATIEIDNNDEFVISSCNKLFIDMIGRQQLFTFPVSINQAFSDIGADEFLYYLHMSNHNKCALEFEISFINNDIKHWWLLISRRCSVKMKRVVACSLLGLISAKKSN
ncbi:MAG: hypothetical protein HRU22_12085 [Gammaproteobacteria bacterium]|nr:hypothetical protein [Gammaproteobacteria bacterium]